MGKKSRCCKAKVTTKLDLEKATRWEEELKKLEINIEDGFFKGCMFYHPAVKEFIEDLLSKQREEFIAMLPEEKKIEKVSPELDIAYNDCLKDIKDKIKQ